MATIDETIKAAIEADGRTLYALAKAANIDQAHLRRYVAGQQSIGIGTANQLCEVLGLTLGPKTAETRPKQPRKKTEDSGGK